MNFHLCKGWTPRFLSIFLALLITVSSTSPTPVKAASTKVIGCQTDRTAQLISAMRDVNSLGGGTIYLGNCPYILIQKNNSAPDGDNGLPVVTSPITLQGVGQTALWANPGGVPFRLLSVNASGSLEVRDMMLRGGNATRGGAISSSGFLKLYHVTIYGNTAGTNGVGGGVYIKGGSATIQYSTFAVNAAGDGGALYITSATSPAAQANVTIIGSTFSSNTAYYAGGGIEADSSNLTILNSTFYGNMAGQNGGAIMLSSANMNGLYLTIAGNLANSGPSAAVIDADLGSTVTLSASIIAGSNNGVLNCSGNVTAPIPNIEIGSYSQTCGVGNINAYLTLGPLQNNGGLTSTMAIAPGSPADGAVPPSAYCPPTDQRMVVRARPEGTGCDLGAYEVGDLNTNTLPPDAHLTLSTNQLVLNQSALLKLEINNPNSTPLSGLATSLKLPDAISFDVLSDVVNTCGGQVGPGAELAGGLVAGSSSCSVEFTLHPLKTGSYDFTTATVLATDSDPVSSNTPDRLSVSLGQVAVTFTSQENPSRLGQPIILTAHVDTVQPGPLHPSGQVVFIEELPSGKVEELGSSTLENGNATVTLSAVPGGQHTYRAMFDDENGSPSVWSSPITQVVTSWLFLPLIIRP